MASAEHHYWGGHAIVGGHLPLAAGVGLAIRYEGTDEAVVCSFGDGSTNIGYFHESVNLSAVWDLPVVWLVENNQYGMGTEVSRASAVKTISEKGRAYDIAYKTVNGQDLLEVYDAMQVALEHARTKGPYLLEAMTYRYSGHSMGDPERYRSKAEIETWRSRDPILRFAKYLAEKDLADETTLAEIDASVVEEIEEVMRFADESPEPEDAALCEFVYVNPQGHR
jgi:pyruvate dehydrogenase E1 component alpha subunit